MANKIIVANWKMYFSTGQASLFLHKLDQEIVARRSVEVVICPHMLALQPLSLQINRRKFKLGAQNCYHKDEGAFTGEVSATMLRHLASYVIVGHSERRNYFAETDKEIALKVQAVLRNGMRPILCVGETKQEHADGEVGHVIHAQVSAGLSNIVHEEVGEVVIAYEPIWAIGSGKFAQPDDVRAAVKLIRKQVRAMFGSVAADKIRVLYGGSVDCDNSKAYLDTEGVDGLLVGGASLKAKVFSKIVESAVGAGDN